MLGSMLVDEERSKPKSAVQTLVREGASADRSAVEVSFLTDRARYWVLTSSHVIVDIYPHFVISLAASLQSNLGLTGGQRAALFSLGPVVSGASQPLFAWLGDKHNTRYSAPAGLAVAALAMGFIGYVQNFTQLVLLVIVGMGGVGVYHPISSALAGSLSTGAHASARLRSARGLGLSIFFAAGMVGGILGPIIATRINEAAGMKWLLAMTVPGLLGAAILWYCTRSIAHREERLTATTVDELNDLRARWFTVGILFVANCLRFITNIGLFFLYSEWASRKLSDPDAASSLSGNLLAASAVGMCLSGLFVGRLMRQGAERRWMIAMGLLAAPVILVMPQLDGVMMLGACFLSAWGFFGVIPASISFAQRLLPHATGMVGAILMGCGWAVSAVSPFIVRQIIGADRSNLDAGFYFLAALMALSGVLALALPGRLIHQSASRR